MKLKKMKTKYSVLLIAIIIFMAFFSVKSYAAAPTIDMQITATDNPQQIATSIQLLVLVSIIALAPSLLIMVTCFPRLIIVLHFVRTALGTQQMPPNQVLIALALFITVALMGDIFIDINENALQPYAAGELSTEAAIARGMEPIREMMIRNVENKDIALFWDISGDEQFTSYDEVPNRILIPAFMLSEVSKAFMIGLYLYIPFIIVDMVVASILMAMGMMMLPPAMISMPFKLLLFIAIDGWNLLIGNILYGFY